MYVIAHTRQPSLCHVRYTVDNTIAADVDIRGCDAYATNAGTMPMVSCRNQSEAWKRKRYQVSMRGVLEVLLRNVRPF